MGMLLDTTFKLVVAGSVDVEVEEEGGKEDGDSLSAMKRCCEAEAESSATIDESANDHVGRLSGDGETVRAVFVVVVAAVLSSTSSIMGYIGNRLLVVIVVVVILM